MQVQHHVRLVDKRNRTVTPAEDGTATYFVSVEGGTPREIQTTADVSDPRLGVDGSRKARKRELVLARQAS